MVNIWEFLIQTAAISLVIGVLLAVKRLFSDKLSPRWQYAIWGILALQILIPVSFQRSILGSLSIWIEVFKSIIEQGLDSAYSGAYIPLSIATILPTYTGVPNSITDWLFVIYTMGVVATILWYVISYLRLRLFLRRGTAITPQMEAKIDGVCRTYGLKKTCRAIAVQGLPSAFVCGVVRPILVLPAEGETDEKILLHELLHLNYHDGLQNVLWCILRSLHWCNPLVQYAFSCISNDMETLCDQRVLERLEGEERRAYGQILLSMANESYPHAIGTTSISNGGKNIARRITAIVRFKKYPSGMGVVSVCISLLMASALLIGTQATYTTDYLYPSNQWEFQRSMALARQVRCTTVASALDTYAKGAIHRNNIYITTVSPIKNHEALATEIQYNVRNDGWRYTHLNIIPDVILSVGDNYCAYNLQHLEDGSYTALLAFTVFKFYAEDGLGKLRDENNDVLYGGTVLIPVTLRDEDGWVVEESGEPQMLPNINPIAAGESIAPIAQYQATGQYGTITLDVTTQHYLDSFETNSINNTKFGNHLVDFSAEYRFHGSTTERDELETVGVELVSMDSVDDAPVFSAYPNMTGEREQSTYSTNGSTLWKSNQILPSDWDGIIEGGSGGTADTVDDIIQIPPAYAVRIFFDGVAVEDLILKEVTSWSEEHLVVPLV